MPLNAYLNKNSMALLEDYLILSLMQSQENDIFITKSVFSFNQYFHV